MNIAITTVPRTGLKYHHKRKEKALSWETVVIWP